MQAIFVKGNFLSNIEIFASKKKRKKSGGKDEIKFKYSTEHVNVEQQKNCRNLHCVTMQPKVI